MAVIGLLAVACAGGTTSSGSNAATDTSSAGGSDIAAVAEGATKIETPLDRTLPLNEASEPQLKQLCTKVGVFRASLSDEMKRFRCLAAGVDASQIDGAGDLTCSRVKSLCDGSQFPPDLL